MACPVNRTEMIRRMYDYVAQYLGDTRFTLGDANTGPAISLQYLRERFKAKNPGLVDYLDEAIAQHLNNEDLVVLYQSTKQPLSKAPQTVIKYPLNPIVDDYLGYKAADQTDYDNEDNGPAKNSHIGDGPGSHLMVNDTTGTSKYDTLWFSALGLRLDKHELAAPYNAVRQAVIFEEFYEWVKSQYSGQVDPSDKLQMNKLRMFYLVNRPMNRMEVSRRQALMYVNRLLFDKGYKEQGDIDYKGLYWKHSFKDKNGRVVNLKTQRLEPEYVPTNFIDGLHTNVRGRSMGDMTVYFALDNMMNLIPKQDGGWFATDTSNEMSYSEFVNLETALSEQNMTFVGMSAGDKGNMLVSYILPEHLEDIAPKKDIVQYFWKKEVDIRLINSLDDFDGSFDEWYSNYLSMFESTDPAIKLNHTQKQNFVKMTKLLDKFMVARFAKLMKKELKQHYNKADAAKHLNGFLQSALEIPRMNKTRAIPMHKWLAGILAGHEWYKGVRGNSYLDYKSLHTFHRMKIPVTKGMILEEMSDTRHLVFDHENVDIYVNDKKIEHYTEVAGLLGVKNISDGWSMVSTDFLDRTADNAGNTAVLENDHGTREVKSVVMYLSKDGKNYVELKHSEQQAIGEVKITQKGDKNALIAQTISTDNGILMYDGDGNTIDMISDLDVAKTTTGTFRRKIASDNFAKFNLPTESRRVVILPRPSSNHSVYGPVQVLNALNFKPGTLSDLETQELNDFIEAFDAMMHENSDVWTSTMLGAVDDPDAMRRIVGYMYSDKAEAKDNIRNKMNATDGIGIHHPDNITGYIAMLSNNFLIKGALQARTFVQKLLGSGATKNEMVGSDYVMKPDLEGRIPLDENGNPIGVILSAGNRGIFNKAVKMMIDAKGVESILSELQDNELVNSSMYNQIVSGSKEEKLKLISRVYNKNVSLVNEFLNDEAFDDMHVLTYRSPILSSVSVAARKILEFTQDDGNAVYHHPSDTFKRLIGDYDIDEAGVFVVGAEFVQALYKFQNSSFHKQRSDYSVDLDIFELGEAAELSNKPGLFKEMVMQIKGHRTQGSTTNTKNLIGTLSQHINNIGFSDGLELRPKNFNDSIIMNYAPLAAGVTQSKLDALGWTWASIIKIGDQNYLKTTVEHEMMLLINAATDHPKLNLITKQWGFGKSPKEGNKEPDNNWLVRKMFTAHRGGQQVSTDEISGAHIRLMRGFKDNDGEYHNGILSQFNYSRVKRGEDGLGRKMKMGQVWYKLEELYRFLQNTPSEQAEILTSHDPIKQHSLPDLSINSLDMNNVTTIEEKLIIRPWQMVLDRYGDDFASSPFAYEEDRIEFAHFQAADNVQDYVANKYKITREGAKKAIILSKRLLHNFHAVFAENNKYTSEAVNYDDDLLILTKNFEDAIKQGVDKYGDGFSAYVSLKYLEGYYNTTEQAHKRKLDILPPLELWNEEVYVEYMKSWEKEFFKGEMVVDPAELEKYKSRSKGLKTANLIARCN
jgi:hypothetical protein